MQEISEAQVIISHWVDEFIKGTPLVYQDTMERTICVILEDSAKLICLSIGLTMY